MKPPQSRFENYDAIIIGARVAGASLAMLLARAGMRVLLVDRASPVKDTVSTHAIMRGGVMLLNQWRLLERIKELGTPPIRETTFHYGNDSIRVEIRERDGVDALYSPRRTVLDPLLVEAALDAGAITYFGATLKRVRFDAAGRACGIATEDRSGIVREFSANLIVGADGADSTVARALGVEAIHRKHFATSTLYGYWRDMDITGTHWLYGHGMAGGATPTNASQSCVFVAMPPSELKSCKPTHYRALFIDKLEQMDRGFAESIRRATPMGRLTSFFGRPGFLRPAYGPGWALVGDAGGFKDPITAHGITDALRDAALLARAATEGSEHAFRRYQEQRDSIAYELNALSDAVASFDWNYEDVQLLHRRLSKLMNRECELLLSLDAAEVDAALNPV